MASLPSHANRVKRDLWRANIVLAMAIIVIFFGATGLIFALIFR